MADIGTQYMGLKLRNPVIVGSSSLTASVDLLEKAEDAGAGAVVLRSIFEEQINGSVNKDMEDARDYLTMGDAGLFLRDASRSHYIDAYLDFVRKAKEKLSIPVIASINCTEDSSWLEYARLFANCGADALELNYYKVAGDVSVPGQVIEKAYIDVVGKTRKLLGKLPFAVKLSWHFTSISNIVERLAKAGTDAVVLFNHFFRPDIDIDSISIDSEHAVQPRGDYSETLRWTAMLASEVKTDFCSSTGIRDWETAVKMLLAGAKAVQMTSAIYEKGLGIIRETAEGLSAWMDAHSFSRIEDFRGILSQERIERPDRWERAQFMKQNRYRAD